MASKVNGLIQKIKSGNTTHNIASSAYGVCETAAGTAAKTVDMTGFTLLEGTTIHIKFNNANTAPSPTLNVNGTGAKVIQLGIISADIDGTIGWRVGDIVDFTYDGTEWIINNAAYATRAGSVSAGDVQPIASKIYTAALYNDSSGANYYQTFATVVPADYNAIWIAHYRITVTASGHSDYTEICDVSISGRSNTYYSYKIYNSIVTYSIYAHALLNGSSASYPHELGYRMASSYGATNVQKTVKIELLEQINCTITLLDNLKLYTSANPTNYTWRTFNATSNGMQETGDNDSYGYYILSNGFKGKAGSNKVYRYCLFARTGDGSYESFVMQDNTRATTKTANPHGFIPDKKIYWNSNNTTYNEGTLNISAYEQYHAIDYLYSFNFDNTFLSDYCETYVVYTYNAEDGLLYLDTTQWLASALPTTADNKIYQRIGSKYYTGTSNYYQGSLLLDNPYYEYRDGAIHEWFPTVQHAITANSIPLSGVTNADDLKAIESISGTGLLKRTGDNEWVLDTTSYTTNAGTVTKISTGAGLTGGDITTTGTIKANLTSETKLTNAAADGTETSGRVYPVRLDKNNKLAVNVPWANTYVTQTAVGDTYTNWRPLLIGSSNSGTEGFSPSTTTSSTYTTATISVQPSTGTIRATTFKGSGESLTSLNASNISSGTLSADRLATSGATAGSYGPSAAVSGSNGATMNVPYITVDNKGRVTAIENKVYTAVNTWRPIGTGATDAAAGNHNHNSNYVQLLSSSTDNAAVRFDGTSGQIQNSAVIIDDNNNVTIPGTALRITSTSNSKYILLGNQDSSGVNCPVILRAANGGLFIGNGTDWSSTTGGTLNTALFMDKDRKIGIGTTSPSYSLDVNGTGRFQSELTLYRSGTTTQNYPARINFSAYDSTLAQTNNGYIAYYNDHTTTYNGNLVINSGGSTFVGAGESAATLYSTLGTTYNSENLFLTADSSVYVYAYADTAANRIGFKIDTSGNVVPQKAEATNSNKQNLGASDNKWASIFGTTFDGSVLKLHQGTPADPSLTGNARIEFDYSSGQPVVISYTPNDSYRNPAGLKVMGGSNATPAWFEVEGTVYAAGFSGSGASLTSLNASNISSGTLAIARIADGSITNAKLENSKITIAGQEVSLGGSLTLANMGLSSAMHFRGKATVAITEDSTTDPTISGYTFGTNGASALAGDVILDKDSEYEYVWTADGTSGKWEKLGSSSSYKTTQTAITDNTGTADGTNTSTTFVYSFSQNANGVVSTKTRALPTASTSTAGITTVGASGGAASYGHTHTLSIATDSGTSNVTTLAANTTYKLTAGGTTMLFKTPADNNTWNALVGATSSANGTAGYVSAPPKDGYNTKFLRADGTWAVPAYLTIGTTSSTAMAGNTVVTNVAHTKRSDTTKFYLTGTTSSATNTSGDTFDTGVYVTTTSGSLSAVRQYWNYSDVDKAYSYFNNTTQSIDFVFI